MQRLALRKKKKVAEKVWSKKGDSKDEEEEAFSQIVVYTLRQFLELAVFGQYPLCRAFRIAVGVVLSGGGGLLQGHGAGPQHGLGITVRPRVQVRVDAD